MLRTSVEIDRTLSDSFPASDPPSWVPGLALVRPLRVSATWTTRAARHLRSALLGAGVVMLLPLYIVGLPIALGLRAVLASTGWRVTIWK